MSIVHCEVLNNHNSFQEIQPKVGSTEGLDMRQKSKL